MEKLTAERFIDVSEDFKKSYGVSVVAEAVEKVNQAMALSNPFARLPVVFTRKQKRIIRRMDRKRRRGK